MTQTEALRLALEALENSVDLVREDAYNAEELYGNYPARQGKVRGLKVLADDHEKAITAIKDALSGEAQTRSVVKDEPVVWNGGVPAMLPKQKEGETFIVSYEPKQEAKDEPVALAWAEGYRMGVADERTSEANIGIAGFNAKVEPARENPYVTTPLQQEVKDEPVAWMDASRFEELRNGFTVMTTLTKKKAFFDDIAIYTTPPQRTWVGLTDEDVDLIANKHATLQGAIWAIEAKLKEKNT